MDHFWDFRDDSSKIPTRRNETAGGSPTGSKTTHAPPESRSDNHSESPLFKLPAEIRARIWELVFGGNLLHIVQTPTRIAALSCWTKLWHDSDAWDLYRHDEDFRCIGAGSSFYHNGNKCTPGMLLDEELIERRMNVDEKFCSCSDDGEDAYCHCNPDKLDVQLKEISTNPVPNLLSLLLTCRTMSVLLIILATCLLT